MAKKKSIPKKIKQLVWNNYIGEANGTGLCNCCNKTTISQMSFHCGHIISEFNGGGITINNLKPICQLCNGSMGTKNMDEFIREHGLGIVVHNNVVANNSIVVDNDVLNDNIIVNNDIKKIPVKKVDKNKTKTNINNKKNNISKHDNNTTQSFNGNNNLNYAHPPTSNFDNFLCDLEHAYRVKNNNSSNYVLPLDYGKQQLHDYGQSLFDKMIKDKSANYYKTIEKKLIEISSSYSTTTESSDESFEDARISYLTKALLTCDQFEKNFIEHDLKNGTSISTTCYLSRFNKLALSPPYNFNK